MKEQYEKEKEKEIKMAGKQRKSGQQKFTIRSQDTSTGETMIWISNETRP